MSPVDLLVGLQDPKKILLNPVLSIINTQGQKNQEILLF